MTALIDFVVDPKVALVTATLVGLFLVERLWPKAAPPVNLSHLRDLVGRWFKNLGFFFINIVLSPLIVIPVTAFADAHALTWRDSYTGGWWILIDLLLLDCAIYWWHRINHTIPFLWRFHQVHHLDEFLDTTSAVRFHFGEVILSALLRVVVIFLLGIDLVSVVVFETLLMVATLFHHSNISLPKKLEDALSLLIITPALHWVHHHALRRDTDSNYGTVLSVWDRLFRSRSRTHRQTNMVIGVEGQKEQSFRRLLTLPFRMTGSGRRSNR